MNQNHHRPLNVRVANFSDADLPAAHLLAFDSDDVDAIIGKIRTHADLPSVFVVGEAWAPKVPELLSRLKAIRSPCYPYALFSLNGAELDVEETDLDVIRVGSTDGEIIYQHIGEYAASRFQFDNRRLSIPNVNPLPAQVDVVIVGAGVTGIYAAQQLKAAGISFCILEKEDKVGGIWSQYANSTSQVNTSESAYRLIEKESRSNRDHSFTREMLEDIAHLSYDVAEQLFLQTEVRKIEKKDHRYHIRLNRKGEPFDLTSKGVILAINDRVGQPRQKQWAGEEKFKGVVVSGISDGTRDVDWWDKNVVIVGMGAFAVENARTALENGARHVTVVCRRHGTVCPKIIDYLNFATPYDDLFQHSSKSNIRNMMYWKKLYDLSGATQPECWMGKIKHDGHTISVSDIWFVAHHLKKIETRTGQITALTETGAVIDHQHAIDADIVVNCIGFEKNSPAAKALSGYNEIYNNNYVDKDFIYLADAYIDSDAFNSLFGSSVLEMVKFYMQVFIKFFDNPDYETMISTPGIEKLPIEDRQWSHYIQGATALIQGYPVIYEFARRHVDQRTKNFLEIHDLQAYIAENKREWIATHELLAGKPMKEEDCLPYIFEKLVK